MHEYICMYSLGVLAHISEREKPRLLHFFQKCEKATATGGNTFLFVWIVKKKMKWQHNPLIANCSFQRSKLV